jgi:hypothetical protein
MHTKASPRQRGHRLSAQEAGAIALIKEFGEGEDRKAKRSSPDCVVFGVAFHHMIEAAGGVLWRKRGESEAEIALVHRKRYDGDWTLPEGNEPPDAP